MPKPLVGGSNTYGIHPVVCCPNLLNSSICFPSDPWCPTFKPPDVYDYQDYQDYQDCEQNTENVEIFEDSQEGLNAPLQEGEATLTSGATVLYSNCIK